VKIGFVTIGQAPRDDMIAGFRERLGNEIELVQRGALDHLTRLQVAALSPVGEEEPLVTQLRTGEAVTIAKERILELMQQRIDGLQAQGAGLIVVLCTGPFPELKATVPLLFPDEVLRHFVTGVMPKGRLGVILPRADQEPMMNAKWDAYLPLTFLVHDPYGGGARIGAGDALRDCQLVVLDCMGYTATTKAAVRDACDTPVLLAQEVLAHAVELLAG